MNFLSMGLKEGRRVKVGSWSESRPLKSSTCQILGNLDCLYNILVKKDFETIV